jgi:hypothetical protein
MNPATPAYTLADRVEFYNNGTMGRRYPDSHLWVRTRILGIWLLGNDYRSRSGYYGSYPPQYLARVTTLFPDSKKVLHLFSGSLPAGDYVRFDLNDQADVQGDAHHLQQYFEPAAFDCIYADPPYSKEHAKRYGTPMVNRKKVLNGCSHILQPGGFVIWLDTVWPQVANARLEQVGTINVLRSQNHVVRNIFISQKPYEKIEPPDKLVNKAAARGSTEAAVKGDEKRLCASKYTGGGHVFPRPSRR